MDRGADVADGDKLDQAANLLMASLRASQALNSQIRKALQHWEQTNAVERLENPTRSADVLCLLNDVLEN